MKMIIAFSVLVAVAIAAPADPDRDAVVVNETPLDSLPSGDYKYGYQLSNGATRDESAQFIAAGPEDGDQAVVGSYSWVDPATNVQYAVEYTAGKDGFQAKGAHIPA